MSLQQDLANIKKRTPIQDVVSFINSIGCKFISFEEEYKNYKTKVNIIYSCGHRGTVSIQVINRPSFSKLCQDCSRHNGNLKKILSVDEIVDIIESYGFGSVKFPYDYEGGKSTVSYVCEYGHETVRSVISFKHNPTCGKCKRLYMSKKFSGENGFNWKGGVTPIKKFLQKKLNRWKKESAENCNFRCFVTGDKFDEIHHLYSFSNIIRNCFEELDLEIYTDISNYSTQELNLIIEKIGEIHNRYPLGICLRKDIHVLFHSLYGTDGETTPQDFYEFVDKINSGEIQI